MRRKITVHVVRTKMCCGGTSYDVYVPCKYKRYQPITNHIYATVIMNNGHKFYEVSEFLRTKKIDNLPALTDERLTRFRQLWKVSERLARMWMHRAFDETRDLDKVPGLWCNWTLPSDRVVLRVKMKDRD